MIESKKRALIFFLLAFILALVVGFLVFEKVKELNAELGGMTEVYVASGEIPSRAIIQENQLTVMELPNKFVTASHITNKSDLENRVSVVPLSSGDIITKNMIKPVSNLQDVNNRLVSIYRTETIQFDQVVEALDRVDIIVSNEIDGEKETKLFMQDVPVVYAQGTSDNFSGIAVEVSVEEAKNLIHAQNYSEHIRILKANVGKDDVLTDMPENNTEEAEEVAEETEQVTEEEKPQEEPAEEPQEEATEEPQKEQEKSEENTEDTE
ncbi:Flp pilus assembly protein CpaB [Saliterribacillus persicus]|uniref:Pilus assembly protein CpaB n=1 Tax=Saliterribacillus persicus TaxID=930114 RepID=A0A368XH89_9BACI|nr:SAF domain-containing protein [Saliterribacillus persicus]RCW65847.1 pilus assembly protein CpaB [Saliterribacillus persicus]